MYKCLKNNRFFVIFTGSFKKLTRKNSRFSDMLFDKQL